MADAVINVQICDDFGCRMWGCWCSRAVALDASEQQLDALTDAYFHGLLPEDPHRTTTDT